MSSPSLQYRGAQFRPVPALWRWWPLAQKEFGLMFRSKASIALFCVCLLPLVVRLFVLMIRYGMVNFGVGARRETMMRSQAMAPWDPERVDFYLELVMGAWPGLPVLILLTAATTAGAVARDRRTNALELLWTRGISPLAYLWAKYLGSLLSLGLVTVVAPLVLWSAAVLMADDWQLLWSSLSFLPGLIAALVLTTALWTALCVLLSAICSAPSQAIVAWCLLVIGSTAIGNVMAASLREPALRASLSVFDAGGILARNLAGGVVRTSAWPAVMFLSVLVVLLAVLAARRLRLREALA